MAKVLFGNGVAEIRGSIAGSTFSRNRGGAYNRNRITPINPQSIDQIAARARVAQLSKRWGTVLTQLERDAWVGFADLNPIVDVLGQALILTGIQAYIQLNARLLAGNAPVIDAPPLNQEVPQVTIISTEFDIGITTPNYEVIFTITQPDVGNLLQIFSTPQLSPGISFVKNRTRLIAPSRLTSPSPIDVKAEWNAKFGLDPLVGAKIVTLARVLGGNGAVSVPARSDTIVVDNG